MVYMATLQNKNSNSKKQSLLLAHVCDRGQLYTTLLLLYAWISAVWLFLSMFSFGFILYQFTELPKSINLCLHQILGSFGPLLVHIIFFLASWTFNETNVKPLILSLRSLRLWVFFLFVCFVFPILFLSVLLFDNFYRSVFKLIDSINSILL